MTFDSSRALSPESRSEMERLRVKADTTHKLLRPFYFQCERCGGMGMDLCAEALEERRKTCRDCDGSGFVGRKPKDMWPHEAPRLPAFDETAKGLRAAGAAEAEERAQLYRDARGADITVLLGPAESRQKLGMIELDDPCAFCKKPQRCGCNEDALHRRANVEIEAIAQKIDARRR